MKNQPRHFKKEPRHLKNPPRHFKKEPHHMKNQPRHFEKEPHHQKLRYIILVTLTGFTKTRRIVSLKDFIFKRRLRDSYSECPPICWPGNLDLQVKVLRKIMRTTYLGLLHTYSPFLFSLIALKSVIFSAYMSCFTSEFRIYMYPGTVKSGRNHKQKKSEDLLQRWWLNFVNPSGGYPPISAPLCELN